MKYKTVIFDLDGTLLDTLDDLNESTNYALESMGYPKRNIAEVRKFVGNGVAKLIERAVPDGTARAMEEKTLLIFKEHYALHCEDKTKPYDGILPLLDLLQKNGIKIAVVSNKIDSAVSELCKKYFGNRIFLAVGDRVGIKRKPDPDSVFEVLQKLGASIEEAVYIGDSEVDVQTAKNAGISFIGVTWGFRDKQILAENGAILFAETPQELESMLLC